ncbi:alpha/beta fold hydrolase [Halorarius litoreus]|uniref:alpha/beta fold hydrolase n=1 Tax=Halorarius litoreus TaxID=2962676 RepID=UPI0020CC4273|nr:alpha/beta hydrolase [Halorarius litoreus]
MRLGPATTGSIAGHPYVAYGTGPPLVVIPGLNDPLARAGDYPWFDAAFLAYCRRLSRRCASAGVSRRVHYVSRPRGATGDVAPMADGYARVLDTLGSTDVLGISMGGFLALRLAATDDRVRSLVCGLAAARLSRHGRESLRTWREWAIDGEWRRIYRMGVRAVVTEPLRTLGTGGGAVWDWLVSEPIAFGDFTAAVDASLGFDGIPLLDDVDCPALVVGGTRDPFFTPEAFAATAEGLDCRFERLDGLGHDAVIEHPERFDGAVARFLRE